jgi:hypothetical protein
MSADELILSGDEAGHTRDSVSPGLFPVFVDSFLERAINDHVMNRVGRQSNRTRDIDQNAGISNVPEVGEVSPVKCTMNCFPAGLRVGPLCKLLGKAAVISVRAAVIWQSFGIHQRFHAVMHGIQVHTPACEEFFERTALGRSFGMKRKVDPLNVYIEVLS